MADYFVSKYYRMDPETMILMTDGSKLMNGMEILIEDPNYRVQVNADRDLPDWEKDRALIHNRWCMVSEFSKKNGLISFVGIYDDGTKVSRDYNVSFSWYVKKTSLLNAEIIKETRERKIAKISELIKDEEFCGCYSREDIERFSSNLLDEIS